MRHIMATVLVALSLLTGCANSANPILKVRNSIARLTGRVELTNYYCTAFPINKDLMLTANHCIHEDMRVDEVKVKKVVKFDEYFDLALLRVEHDHTPLQFRDEEVHPGEGLTGMGFANGWEVPVVIAQTVLIPRFPWSKGTPKGIMVSPGYIGGMSGGPVVDGEGLVVGMCQRSDDGIGYGVGTKLIKAFLYDAGVDLKE